ncbi:MAG TPA: PrsW family glutamic-type intramembrane protease [Rectinemataceae bacterium]|nr:PrsW family glutamic-type intramembrane protease [Rectinemataceae bacterium]
MSSLLLALALAALPAVLLIAFFYRLDRARPEPMRLIVRSVLFGFLAVIPAAGIELALGFLVPSIPGVPGTLFEAFIVAGLVEESVKLYFVRRYIFRRPEFDERSDGIIYAICVSLGFAFIENFMYGHDDLRILLIRSFTAVPGHAVFSGVMGYYVGMAKLEPGKSGAWRTGLFWAVLLHGLYDALLLSGALVGYLVFPLLLVGWRVLRRLFAKAQAIDLERQGA